MPASSIFSPYAIAQGSSNYYASLFLPERLRPFVRKIFALNYELTKIPNEVSDLSVANAKLVWWLQDIEKMYRQQAEHPLLQQLTPFVQQTAINKNLFINLIAAAQQDLEQTRYFDETSLTKYAKLSGGSLYTLLFHAICAQQPSAVNSYETGCAIKLAQLLINVGQDAKKHRVYLPSNTLKQFGITTKELLDAQYSPNFASLMRQRCEQIRLAFNELITANLPLSKTWLIFLFTTLSILIKELEQLAKNDFNLLTQYIDITPLSKLLIAIKIKLKFQFGRNHSLVFKQKFIPN